MRDEVAPNLASPSGVDLQEYQATVIHRFANPAICDQVRVDYVQVSSRSGKSAVSGSFGSGTELNHVEGSGSRRIIALRAAYASRPRG